MAGLLANAGIDLSKPNSFPMPKEPVTLIGIGGSVLLRDEYRRNFRRVKVQQYQDRTGYECFLNHVHLPSRVDRRSFLTSFGYIYALHNALARFCMERHFRIIASFSSGECTVRFYQFRQNETWLGDDLEGYKNAILEIDTSDLKGNPDGQD
jgi:hypothetical protein